MAKQRKRMLPARKTTSDEDVLLVRSAESLGRVIGSLQRQLQGMVKRAGSSADKAKDRAKRASRVKAARAGKRDSASTGKSASAKRARGRKAAKKR